MFCRQVELHTHGLDRYGRTLAIVMLDGNDINLEQVRSGFAWVFERYLPTAPVDVQQSYRQAGVKAKEQRRGLWSDDQVPMAPWQWRHARQ